MATTPCTLTANDILLAASALDTTSSALGHNTIIEDLTPSAVVDTVKSGDSLAGLSASGRHADHRAVAMQWSGWSCAWLI